MYMRIFPKWTRVTWHPTGRRMNWSCSTNESRINHLCGNSTKSDRLAFSRKLRRLRSSGDLTGLKSLLQLSTPQWEDSSSTTVNGSSAMDHRDMYFSLSTPTAYLGCALKMLVTLRWEALRTSTSSPNDVSHDAFCVTTPYSKKSWPLFQDSLWVKVAKYKMVLEQVQSWVFRYLNPDSKLSNQAQQGSA